MTIEEMRKRKRELGYSNKLLSMLSGVPVPTLQKILSGKTDSPRRETLLKLESALEAGAPPAYTADCVKEPESVYDTAAKKPGEYTLEDYLALPEERRVELIDGVFYDTAAPTTVHQAIGGFIYKLLLDFALAHKGPCMPFMSPVDVQLDEDDRTVVQPDVLIVCDRKKFQNGRVFGAPDFIAEVLSGSTRKKDMYLKHMKYRNAGVREYWMIDPAQKSIVVCDMEHDAFPQVYGFGESVPVMVWNNECMVDFAQIYDFISFLYD